MIPASIMLVSGSIPKDPRRVLMLSRAGAFMKYNKIPFKKLCRADPRPAGARNDAPGSERSGKNRRTSIIVSELKSTFAANNMKGTYNRQFKIVAKDHVKKLLFYFDWNRAANRKRVQETEDTDELFGICNRVLGVHQSRYEITELIRYLNTHNRPKVICEIGTANSGTNLLLGRAVTSAEFIVGIDLYVKNRSRLRYYLSPKQSAQFNGRLQIGGNDRQPRGHAERPEN